MRTLHTWTDTTARIAVEGLARSVRVLHVTDSHVALIDERDAEHAACAKSRAHFAEFRTDAAGKPVFSEASFAEVMAGPEARSADLIALTGDIVHFPAQASLAAAAEALAVPNVPWLYTPGNHDWYFSGRPATDAERALRRPALAPLHGGQASHSVRDVGGVRFLAIDDSNYQIDEEQLEFARGALAGGLPTVLLIHIPLSLPTLRPPTLARWKDPILLCDPEWPAERRARWHTQSDARATEEFARLAARAENLVAVLCGHIHFPHADNLHPGAVQYVGKPGYEGGWRMCEFTPLDAAAQ